MALMLDAPILTGDRRLREARHKECRRGSENAKGIRPFDGSHERDRQEGLRRLAETLRVRSRHAARRGEQACQSAGHDVACIQRRAASQAIRRPRYRMLRRPRPWHERGRREDD
ncbi:uncharacterized protein MAM_08000 [Metarhizium album ARSEF 1941]|uniref:Uncharacterized protein n=1 Tax=Metarhizium album (strain ARSEF 1941) TaxID=1081103 RepID=A0A0B2WMB7_METAS|nr:uncharacterized protein MAM_08000 [Metarhizium album ARSEF 1941]KHN94160.1 hypothetical protein MAM_08000 [Metarhizium album ARSEF 1941]